MNHDMTHCADWRKSRCPQRCFRARLTRELFERKARGELAGIPMSFAHLRGTAECWEKSRSDSSLHADVKDSCLDKKRKEAIK